MDSARPRAPERFLAAEWRASGPAGTAGPPLGPFLLPLLLPSCGASGACATIIAPEMRCEEWWSDLGLVVAAARMRRLGHASNCLRGRSAEARRAFRDRNVIAIRQFRLDCRSRRTPRALALRPAGRGGAARGRILGQSGAAPPAEADQPRRAGHARLVPRVPAPPLPYLWWRAPRGAATSRHSGIGSNAPERNHRAPGQAGRILPLPRDLGGGGHRRRTDEDLHGEPASGVPAPSGDATVEAFRRGIRRVKHAARGLVRPMFRGEISAPEMPQELPPDARAAGQLSLSPVASARNGRQRAVISRRCRTARRVTMTSTRGSWGTKTDGRLSPFWGPSAIAAAQASLQPCLRPPSPAREPLLVDSVRRAMERLLAAAPEVLAALARGFAAAGQDRHPPGPAAVATWPAEVRAFAPRDGPASMGSASWRTVARFSGRDCSGTSHRPFSWQASSLRLPGACHQGPGGTRTPLVAGRTSCGGGRRRRSSTTACRVPLGTQALLHVIHPSTRACRRPEGLLLLQRRLGGGSTSLTAPERRGWGYSLRELLRMAAHWEPGLPAGWPRRAGFEQPADGSLRRLWLGSEATRLLTDEELAAQLCPAACSHCQRARSRSS